MVEDRVDEDKGGSWIGSSLQGLVKKLLKFRPVLDGNYRKKVADQSGNSSLDKQMLFLDVLIEEEVSELSFFWFIEILI